MNKVKIAAILIIILFVVSTGILSIVVVGRCVRFLKSHEAAQKAR